MAIQINTAYIATQIQCTFQTLYSYDVCLQLALINVVYAHTIKFNKLICSVQLLHCTLILRIYLAI